MIRLFLITTFIFISNSFYGQSLDRSKKNALAVDSITGSTFRNGDMLSIKVRNLTARDRGFDIAAISLEDNSHGYDMVYSAWLNHDKQYFKKLRTAKEISAKKNIKFVLPEYSMYPYHVKANSSTTLRFIVKGTPLQKGILLMLIVSSDIIDGDFDTIYSNSFRIFSLPN